MPTTVDCPNCSRKLRIPDELLGKKVKCPQCGNAFVASASAPAPQEMEEEEAPAPPPRAAGTPARRAAAPPPAEDEEQYEDEPPARRRRGGNGGDLKPHRGQMIMLLGILSFFVAGPILGPIAWIMGNNDLKEMRAGRMDPEGEGNTKVGKICGMIATFLSIGGLALCCVFYVIIGIFAAAGSNVH
jgi:predicted Zn finger-like uncharacterized protein